MWNIFFFIFIHNFSICSLSFLPFFLPELFKTNSVSTSNNKTNTCITNITWWQWQGKSISEFNLRKKNLLRSLVQKKIEIFHLPSFEIDFLNELQIQTKKWENSEYLFLKIGHNSEKNRVESVKCKFRKATYRLF